MLIDLLARFPDLTVADIERDFTPPPQFAKASFDNYIPDADHPSQQQARDAVREFGKRIGHGGAKGLFGMKRAAPAGSAGVYLDGGFGVGKTHLLAALWHTAHGRKTFGTFIEYTALVGALGYAEAVKTLSGVKLMCIDEFELDDPGDTMIMTRLLGELIAGGTKVAATSNTPPNALGEGRFAAADFLREISAIASYFTMIRIDGEDYRHRDVSGAAVVTAPAALKKRVAELDEAGSQVAQVDFRDMLKHLSKVHPSRYIKLVDHLEAIAITNVEQLDDQADALRWVAFIDRLYDAQVPIIASGLGLHEMFAPDMLSGGYRKKYLRCVSRMGALTAA